MDNLSSNDGSRKDKLEAIHLLPEIDVKSVKNYVSELLRLNLLKKSEFTAECLICKSSKLKNWKNLVEHLRNPSHIVNIRKNCKQFSAICIICKFILIADDAGIIFDHFILHKTGTDQKDQRLHKSFDNETAIDSSINSSPVINDDNYGIIRQPELRLNSFEIRNCGYVTLPSDEKLISSSSMSVVSPPVKDSICENFSGNNSKTCKNLASESSQKCFYPKQAYYSKKSLQLISPGVSKDEFNARLELNTVNIRDYCSKTYYSLYYGLRKLYFSCLDCNVTRLQENHFYKHLTGIKHHNNLGDCYDISYIKICDICQVLLLGRYDLIEEHFEFYTHHQNVKCKMGSIKQQLAVLSGDQKLGFSGELSDKCIMLFSSKETLNTGVESSLKEAREVASLTDSLLKILERDIYSTIKEKCADFKVKIAGSRIYGLANKQSDVDIYLNTGDVSIGDLEEYFHRAVDLFEVERTILDAKVPIIRVKHQQSGLICDINTTNPKGSYSSELIKLYISLDERVRWLAMAVLEWSAVNDIRGSRKFTSYALMCIVLFFLMTPRIRLIPSVHTLKSLYEGSRVIIKGWDFSFCRDIEKIKKVHNPSLCTLNKYELLTEFFHYYLKHDGKSVLFPHSGELYRKVVFANPVIPLYPGIHTNKEDSEPLSIGGRFIVIDLFCLRENVNRTVDENLFDHFKSICYKTLTCGWQNC